MSLISFDGCLIPESNIEMMRQQKRAADEWVWTVRLKDRDTPLSDTLAPSIVSMTPNTSGVRMLIVSLYDSNNVPAYGVRERPIVAWRTEVSVETDSAITEPTAIVPDYIGSSNETWCYFDPTSGQYWDAEFSVGTREAAVECLLEDLRSRRALRAKAAP